MNNEVSKIDFFIHVVFKMNAAKIRIFSEEVKLKNVTRSKLDFD